MKDSPTVRRWLVPTLALVAVLALAFVTAQSTAQPAGEDAPAAVAPAEPLVPPISEAPTPAAPPRSFLDEDDASADRGLEVPNMGKALAKLIGVMILLLALLAGGLVLFQRVSRRGLAISTAKRPLQIVDKVSLGPRQGVVLLKTCGRFMVLGVSDKEISVLMDVNDAPEASFAQTLENAEGVQPAAQAQG